MDTLSALQTLDHELKRLGSERTLYICGGAALILLKVTSRATMGVDVLQPKVDQTLGQAAKIVAKLLGLSDAWLNNGPEDLLSYLDSQWETSCTKVYEGKSLKVFALSRIDLIKSKLWAACDRMDDILDLVALNPSDMELVEARAWVLGVDSSEIWPNIVDGCLKELARRRHHE